MIHRMSLQIIEMRCAHSEEPKTQVSLGIRPVAVRTKKLLDTLADISLSTQVICVSFLVLRLKFGYQVLHGALYMYIRINEQKLKFMNNLFQE